MSRTLACKSSLLAPPFWRGVVWAICVVRIYIGLENSSQYGFNTISSLGSWIKGPLPQQFIDDQFDLQLQILKRMQEYGMIPALPAFAGHVPEEIASIYTQASVSRSPNWGNFPDQNCCVYMLEPTDPLYQEIGKTFIQEQQRLYNGYTSSLYQADTYNEMQPSQSDIDYLTKASKAVIDSMIKADSNAVWLMQGWLFIDESYWTNEHIEAYLGGVANDRMIILDLYR